MTISPVVALKFSEKLFSDPLSQAIKEVGNNTKVESFINFMMCNFKCYIYNPAEIFNTLLLS